MHFLLLVHNEKLCIFLNFFVSFYTYFFINRNSKLMFLFQAVEMLNQECIHDLKVIKSTSNWLPRLIMLNKNLFSNFVEF